MSIVFGINDTRKLRELAVKANGGYQGTRATQWVATKYQQILLFEEENPAQKNEACFENAEPNDISQTGSKIYTTQNMHEMICMNPENWLAFSRTSTEYLSISDFPLIGSVSEIPKILKCTLSRETDTIQLTIIADFGNGRQLMYMMDPGVAIIKLENAVSIMFEGTLPNSTIVTDIDVNILPDERSEKVGHISKGEFVVVLNKENVYDDETGVQWSLVKTLDNVRGWIPTASISNYAVIYGKEVVDVAKYIDSTISSSWRIGDVAVWQKETLAGILTSLMAGIVKSYFQAQYDEIVKLASNSGK